MKNLEKSIRTKYPAMIPSVLKSGGLMEKGMEDNFSAFKEMAIFLKGIVDKENKGIERTDNEYARVMRFGGELERLTLQILAMVHNKNIIDWTEINEYEKRMPLIADVHTAYYFLEQQGLTSIRMLWIGIHYPAKAS